jgi:hypothetical protein
MENRRISSSVKKFIKTGIIDSNSSSYEINLMYILNMFLNDSLFTILTLINRKNYGSITSNDMNVMNVIIPFSYVESPSYGSQFSNPILVMCLTIIEHLVYDKYKYSIEKLSYYSEILEKEYLKSTIECRSTNDLYSIFTGLEIDVENTSKLLNAIKSHILDLIDKIIVKKIICMFICSNEILYSKTQRNISGIDLIMSYNTKYKAGFTGTPSSYVFYDCDNVKTEQINIGGAKEKRKIIERTKKRDYKYESTHEMDYEPNIDEKIIVIGKKERKPTSKYYEDILSEEETTVAPLNIKKMYIHKMKKSDYMNLINIMRKSTIDLEFEDVLINKLITNIIEKYKNTKVLIDAGGLIVGKSPRDVFDIVNKVIVINKFIFWDSSHKAKYYKDGDEKDWNDLYSGEDNLFYYFDQQHTTGIDVKIKDNTHGILLLNNTPRFRDIVQSMYRMRKVNDIIDIGGKKQYSHMIKFVCTKNIKISLLDDKDSNIDNLINIFIENEVSVLKEQNKLLLCQNLRALYRFTSKGDCDRYMLYNNFNFPKKNMSDIKMCGMYNITEDEIVKLIKNETTLTLLQDKYRFNDVKRTNDHVYDTIKNIKEFVEKIKMPKIVSTSQTISQAVNTSEKKTSNINVNININTVFMMEPMDHTFVHIYSYYDPKDKVFNTNYEAYGIYVSKIISSDSAKMGLVGVFNKNNLFIHEKFTSVKLSVTFKDKKEKCIIVNDLGSVIYQYENVDHNELIHAKFRMLFFEKYLKSNNYFPVSCYEYLIYNENEIIERRMINLFKLISDYDNVCKIIYDLMICVFNSLSIIDIRSLFDKYNNLYDTSLRYDHAKLTIELKNDIYKMYNKKTISYSDTLKFNEVEYKHDVKDSDVQKIIDFINYITCYMRRKIINQFTS